MGFHKFNQPALSSSYKTAAQSEVMFRWITAQNAVYLARQKDPDAVRNGGAAAQPLLASILKKYNAVVASAGEASESAADVLPIARGGVARLQLRAGLFDEAERTLRAQLAAHPRHSETHFEMGVLVRRSVQAVY